MPGILINGKCRADLIRTAIRRLKNPTTRRIQEYILKHYGVYVKQPLVCNTRNQLLGDQVELKAKKHLMYLRVLIRELGHEGVVDLVNFLEEEET